MNRVAGKVALVTGAARGQGRAHALRLAEEGADIIALDACTPVDTAPYPMASTDELAETAKLIEEHGRRVVTAQADVRDLAALDAAVQEGLDALGRLDIVVANAGIASFGPVWELSEAQWGDMIDINLSGVWRTMRAAVPRLIEQGTGGSLVLTSSIAGLVAFPNLAHYTAAKHGVTGLAKSLAVELAPHRIRANSVHPSSVDTMMLHNDTTYRGFTGLEGATRDQVVGPMQAMNALPLPWIDIADISNAVLHLCSDEARYVTGTAHVIDAGALAPFKLPHS